MRNEEEGTAALSCAHDDAVTLALEEGKGGSALEAVAAQCTSVIYPVNTYTSIHHFLIATSRT